MTNYKVTLENLEGNCKRVTVKASSPYDAMAMCQKGGWYPVDVQAV